MVSWTENELQAYQDRKDKGANARRKTRDTVLEQNPGAESLATDQSKEADPTRDTVIYISYRRRTLDDENCCTKYMSDALRYSGVLESDSYKRTKVRVFQVQVHSPEEERTVIHIIPKSEQ